MHSQVISNRPVLSVLNPPEVEHSGSFWRDWELRRLWARRSLIGLFCWERSW
jgi:hypothetical protein